MLKNCDFVRESEENQEYYGRETGRKDMSEEERETMKKVSELISFAEYGRADMPEGTIVTAPYYDALLDELKENGLEYVEYGMAPVCVADIKI